MYNTLFKNREAIKDEDRGRLWVVLLEAEKHKNAAAPGIYQKLLAMENPELEEKIKKD